jgi:hypothetical protein
VRALKLRKAVESTLRRDLLSFEMKTTLAREIGIVELGPK